MGSLDQGAHDYRKVNRLAWSKLARRGCDSSRPASRQQFADARLSLDPDCWIDWSKVRQVLCLASGGGQQAPLFASLDCRVTSVDLCPEQLQRDRATARRYGLDLECLEADMLDLSPLYGRDFDLVYQAISSCYVPDVRKLYAEVSRVVRGGGYYRVEHWNPTNMQLADDHLWTGRGYELVRPYVSGQRCVWHDGDNHAGDRTECWHYIHTLSDLIGGLCDQSFAVLRFAERQAGEEPRSGVYSYVPPFLSLYARKLKGQNGNT
jgi:SAM-dependent methyltransferase